MMMRSCGAPTSSGTLPQCVVHRRAAFPIIARPSTVPVAESSPPQPLSPGRAGRVFNPLVKAEFRRWVARPLQYLGIVAATLAGIILLYYQSSALTAVFGMTPVGQFLRHLTLLIARPSTIVPLLMVWRALVSFRDGGLYRPFHTTFLTPGEFLWGIITIPFLVSFAILVAYVGAVLMPAQIEGFYAFEPVQRGAWVGAIPLRIFLVLFEGAANGAVICFLALYVGLRGGATLAALFPVLIGVVLIQALQAVHFLFEADVSFWVSVHVLRPVLPATWVDESIIRESARLLVPAFPKLLACVVLWMLTVWHLRLRDYE